MKFFKRGNKTSRLNLKHDIEDTKVFNYVNRVNREELTVFTNSNEKGHYYALKLSYAEITKMYETIQDKS